MDPQSLVIVFRMTERILGVALGGLLVYFGYRLFLDFRGKRDGSGDFQIAGSRLKISKVGPGVFFSLFGAALIAFSFLRPVSITTSSPTPQPPSPSSSKDAAEKEPLPALASVNFLGATEVPDADARRARLREDRKHHIAALNRALANPSPSWSTKDRADLDRSVAQVKLALMEPVWTDDWGDLADFRDWVEKQGPIPEGTTPAVQYLSTAVAPMRPHWLVLALLCIPTGAVVAQGYNDLYSDAQLEADAARYGEQVRAEYRETIFPKLTPAEKAALADVRFEFPITGKRKDLFEFYSDEKTVYLPALSLRFCSDLFVAVAWLNAHGYDGTTVRDYVGFLHHHARVSTAPWPPLFKVLGVPPNARDEPAVAARASRDFGNTVVFLIAHELGHIVKAHHADIGDLSQRRAREIEADQFAMSVMRRLPQIPFGIEQWFDWDRIRHEASTKIPTEAQWQKYLAGLTHPVTKDRLEALAAEIEKAPEDFVGARLQQNPALWTTRAKMFAQTFRLAAPFSGHPVARAAEYSRIRDLRLSALKPRPAAFAIPGVTPGVADIDFEGFYRARRTSADGNKASDFDMLLMRTGADVTGNYAATHARGSIEGKVEGKVLRFQWTEGDTKGRGRLDSSGETFTGTWGHAESEDGSGTWQGSLRKKAE